MENKIERIDSENEENNYETSLQGYQNKRRGSIINI